MRGDDRNAFSRTAPSASHRGELRRGGAGVNWGGRICYCQSTELQAHWTPLQVLEFAEKLLSIVSSLVTIGLGGLAFVGIYNNRDKLSLLLRYLRLSYIGERAKRLKETLGKLEALNYGNKEDRQEIFALMGQISGQLKALEREHTSLTPIQVDLDLILAHKMKLSEAHKRRILFSIHSAVDASSQQELTKLPDSHHDN